MQDESRSWLLIKHRDEWAGPVDVTEFAMSVKSNGDFADILAQEQPDIWLSNRPARGGEAGAMFERIVKRALALKAGEAPAEEEARPSPPSTAAKTRKAATRARPASPRKQVARSAGSKSPASNKRVSSRTRGR